MSGDGVSGASAAPDGALEPRWEAIGVLPETWFEFCLFTPRWHGWARWEYAICVPFSQWTFGRDVVAHGWTRRPKDSSYVTINTRRGTMMDGDSSLVRLATRLNTVGAFWHDAYAKWQVVADGQRRTFEDCRLVGWGDTLSEAVAAVEAALWAEQNPRVDNLNATYNARPKDA